MGIRVPVRTLGRRYLCIFSQVMEAFFLVHLAQPHLIAVHVLDHTPMLFTKPPAQKGAVHKIARPEKKSGDFRPPQNGRAG